MVTGKGFGDYSTRNLLSRLERENDNLIFVGICDYNPSGASILLNYKYGSISSNFETHFYCVKNLHWLSLLHHDIVSIITQLPQSQKQILTDYDLRVIESICSSPIGKENSTIIDQLARMKLLGFKLELQSLYSLGIKFIVQFLCKKILNKDWIL